MMSTTLIQKTPVTRKLSLPERINKLKEDTGFVQYRSLAVDKEGKLVSKLDKRIVCGYLCKWGNRNDYGEKFVKGAFAKSISERGPDSQAKYKITFLWQHDMCDPLAVFAILKEDDYGLYFETEPLDDVPNGDRTITQIKSGTLNQFSIGFYYIWDKIEWDETDDSLVILEADMIEGSVVTAGADSETYAIRTGKLTSVELYDEIENFINILPKKDRFQARQLFTQQKALEQIEKRKADITKGKSGTELKASKPPMKKSEKKKINLNFVTKNL